MHDHAITAAILKGDNAMRPTDTNISICGHAKHGKSTVAGRLMYTLGAVTESDLKKYREEAERRGKDFNEFSMVFLKQRSATFSKPGLPDDLSRTVFPERGSVTLKDNRLLTLIDTPGYSRFIDNIIYGIFLADLAIIIVEASAGVGYGTIAVSRILSSFAIPTIAIYVTKMDVVGYSELRFNEVKEEIEGNILPLLQPHSPDTPPIIPVSALSGVGFDLNSKDLSWYKGINAVQAIEEAKVNTAPEAVGGIRFAVEGSKEIFSPPGVGTVLVGTLETGRLQPNDELLIEPASRKEDKPIITRVRSVQRARSVTDAGKAIANEVVISARAIVAVSTSNLSREDAERYLRHGGVLGAPSNPPSIANEISAELIFFEPDTVYSGKDYTILANASRSTAKILEVEKTGGLEFDLERDEYDARAAEPIKAHLKFGTPLCIEESEEFQRLTRFVLREHNRVVACGRCLEILS